MGAETTIDTGRLAPPPGGNPQTKRPRTGTERPKQALGNSGTPATGTGKPTGTDPSRPRTGEAEKAPVPGLADVTVAPAPAEPQKKQRRKPATKKKQKDEGPATADQIQALILTASTIVATRPGCEVWALKPEEANQLATPIANMIAKSEHLKNLGEHADAIALVTASVMIFGPRTYIYLAQQKAKKIQQSGGVQLVRGKKPEPEKRKDAGSRERPAEHGPADGEKPVTSIHDTIPGTIF